MNPRHQILASEYLAHRRRLLEDFPELADDQQTLADTLEGMVDAPTVIAEFVRGAMADEALADALSKMLSDMGERKARLELRADRRRQAAQTILASINERRLEMPDFTASIRAVPAKLEIYDEAALPEELFKVMRSPDRTAIKNALAKAPIAGARMTNGGETLSIRTK